MIVPSNAPVSPAKSNDQLGSPPAYQYNGYSTVPSGSRRPTLPPLATSSTPILVKQPQGRSRSAACKRFAKAFFVAVLIYLFAAAIFGSLSWGIRVGGEWSDSGPEWPEHTGADGNWQIARDGCSVSWDYGDNFLTSEVMTLPNMEFKIPDALDINIPGTIANNALYHSHTSLTLSPEAVKHLIVGNRAYGNIQFTVSSDPQLRDIKVDITAYYHRMHVFEKVRICKLSGKEGGEGIGIYIPTHRGPWHREDRVTFEVMVTFPILSSAKNPLVVNSFETYLSIFRHHFHELQNKVFFQSLNLRSSDAPLRADAVEIAQGYLKTSNSGIEGKFLVNNSLVLDTSNGKIDIELELEDKDRKSSGVDVTLRSSNAPISVNANLYAQLDENKYLPFKSDKGGRFSLDARTSNGHLTLNVPTIPYEAELKLTGKSSNAPIDIQLDRKGSFEGSYKADTSSYLGVPTVEKSDRGEGKDGHRRVLETNFVGRGTIAGKVYWDIWDRKTGAIEVKTSNAKIILSI